MRRLPFEILTVKHLLDPKLACIVSPFLSCCLYLNILYYLKRYTKNYKVFMFRLEMVMQAKCFVSILSYLSSKLWNTRSKSLELSPFRILFSSLLLWLLSIIL